eukprot:jgi/Mesvir1/12627/Mv26530-RA.1
MVGPRARPFWAGGGGIVDRRPLAGCPPSYHWLPVMHAHGPCCISFPCCFAP